MAANGLEYLGCDTPVRQTHLLSPATLCGVIPVMVYVVPLPTLMCPGERVPLVQHGELFERLLDRMVDGAQDDHPLLGVVFKEVPDGVRVNGCLLEVQSIFRPEDVDAAPCKAITKVTHRIAITSLQWQNEALGLAQACIVPEIVHFPSYHPQTKLPVWTRRFTDPTHLAAACIKLVNHLQPTCSVQHLSAMSATDLSYYLVRSLAVSSQTRFALINKPTTNERLLAALHILQRQHSDSWLSCSQCGTVLTQRCSTYQVDAELFETHVNPHGFVHQVIAASTCQNVLVASSPTLRDTWFSGYTWEILMCNSCFQHIGWKYQNASVLDSTADEDPQRDVFYGLCRGSVAYSAAPTAPASEVASTDEDAREHGEAGDH
eukprot:m.362536 g.362536  ORF g.362536 m.362536 type:complete len:376 (+) comp20623_c0_seq1:137-1264(+)